MMKLDQIEKRRAEILQEIAAIRSMNGATLKEQMLHVKHKDKKEPVLCGPYFVEARWDPQTKKTKSRRVPKHEVQRVKRDVENHQRFVRLTAEFARLTEQLGQLERALDEHDDALKKKPKRPSRKIRR